MIKSWKHRGLREFYLTGSKKGIRPEHAKRLKIILQFLENSLKPADLNLPGMHFHKLLGTLNGFYSVSVSGNWRIIFKFEDQDAVLIDYLDYH